MLTKQQSICEFFNRLEAVLDGLGEPVGELRTPCAPDDKASAGEHKHLCKCGACWRHSNSLSGLTVTSAQFDEAHSCPSCGTQVTVKHY